MNYSLIQSIEEKKVILFNGKVMPVLDRITFEGSTHLILGKRSRSILAFSERRNKFVNVPFSATNTDYPTVPKASRKMPTVLSKVELKTIVESFVATYQQIEYDVKFDKSVNSGFANVRHNFISVPYLKSNCALEDGGFLEYTTVLYVWRKFGYNTRNGVVSKNYVNLQEKLIFSIWAFMVHELSHIVHRNRVKEGRVVDSSSHGNAYCQALSDILSDNLYDEFYKKVKENL